MDSQVRILSSRCCASQLAVVEHQVAQSLLSGHCMPWKPVGVALSMPGLGLPLGVALSVFGSARERQLQNLNINLASQASKQEAPLHAHV